jgi:hypothetical protein
MRFVRHISAEYPLILVKFETYLGEANVLLKETQTESQPYIQDGRTILKETATLTMTYLAERLSKVSLIEASTE